MRDRNEFILANLIEARAKQQPDLEWMLGGIFGYQDDNIYEWTAT